MADFLLMEKLHKMVKEVSIPRLMFKKGISVQGFFRPYMSLSDYTSASIFSSSEQITPVRVRFASMLGNKGTADTIRNIKGMGIKFITDEGYHDMICQNIPILFINDKDKLLDMFDIFSKREQFDGINKEKFWDFVVRNPEAINGAVHLYSYEGITQSFINVKWFSVNTMIWRNSNNRECIVRYKWVPLCEDNERKYQKLTKTSAEFIAGFDPDRAHNELIGRILSNDYPSFELHVQIMEKRYITDNKWLEHTVMWDDNKSPFMAVGMMVLDRIAESSGFDDEMLYFFADSAIKGIELFGSELLDILEYLCRTEAIERGAL